MGWSFRRSKSFGLFRLSFSKSGVGFSFGMRGARVGVNAKGKKYVRGGIPGTGLYYQSSLPDAQPRETSPSTASVSPLGILVCGRSCRTNHLRATHLETNGHLGSCCPCAADRCSGGRHPSCAHTSCEAAQAEARH